jgi:hypothetical protein
MEKLPFRCIQNIFGFCGVATASKLATVNKVLVVFFELVPHGMLEPMMAVFPSKEMRPLCIQSGDVAEKLRWAIFGRRGDAPSGREAAISDSTMHQQVTKRITAALLGRFRFIDTCDDADSPSLNAKNITQQAAFVRKYVDIATGDLKPEYQRASFKFKEREVPWPEGRGNRFEVVFWTKSDASDIEMDRAVKLMDPPSMFAMSERDNAVNGQFGVVPLEMTRGVPTLDIRHLWNVLFFFAMYGTTGTRSFDQGLRTVRANMLDAGKVLACAHCGNRASLDADGNYCYDYPASKLSRCAACKNVSYCSRACQRAHWPTHKPACHTTAPSKAAPSAADVETLTG